MRTVKMAVMAVLALYAMWMSGVLAEERAGYSDDKLGIEFPGSVGDCKFVKMEKYDKSSLGYCVRYVCEPWLNADVFVYDKGVRDIPDGCTQKIFEDEIAEINAVINIMEERGLYKNVKKIESGLWPDKDKPICMFSRHEYSLDGRDMVSDSYVVGYKKNFIKIRCSYLKEKEKEGRAVSEAMARQFMRQNKAGNDKPVEPSVPEKK